MNQLVCAEKVNQIVAKFSGRDEEGIKILTLSVRHRSKSKLQITLWFLVKSLHHIYRSSYARSEELFQEVLAEIEWFLKWGEVGRWREDMRSLKSLIEDSLF